MQVWGASNGLNTNSFVTCTVTYTNTAASPVSLEWNIGRQYDHAGGTGWTTDQTTGTCILKNFSIFASGSTTTTFTGDVTVAGTMTASSKSFDILHEAKPDMRLRHWCTEGDAPGGSLIYKRQVTAVKAGVVDLLMPSWFQWLAKDVHIFCNGFKHHGKAWGEQDALDPCVIHLNVSKGGVYNVLVTADRNDMCATTMCPQAVEYSTAVPPKLLP